LIDGPGHADPLTPEALQSVVQQAIVPWNHEGADPAVFQGLNVQVADLPGTYLGLATGNKVLIDADADGYGWRLSTSSTTDLWGGSASMDLLTAARHELAHVLGFDHDDRDAVMAPTLLTDASHLGRSPVDDLSAGLAPLLLPSRQAHDSLFSQFGRGDTSSPAENDVLRSSKQDHMALARFLTLDGNESFLIDRLHANKHDLDGADDDELFDLLLGDSADLRIDAKSAEIEQRL